MSSLRRHRAAAEEDDGAAAVSFSLEGKTRPFGGRVFSASVGRATSENCGKRVQFELLHGNAAERDSLDAWEELVLSSRGIAYVRVCVWVCVGGRRRNR